MGKTTLVLKEFNGMKDKIIKNELIEQVALISSEELKERKEHLEKYKFSDNVEQVEKAIDILKKGYDFFEEKRKEYYKPIDNQMEDIREYGKIISAKRTEGQKHLAKLVAAETEARKQLTLTNLKNYFEEKCVDVFDFVDFDFIIEYASGLNSKLDFTTQAWNTKKGAIASSGKQFINELIEKFQGDYLYISEGTEQEQEQKMLYYKASHYNIKETQVAFIEWKEKEEEKAAAVAAAVAAESQKAAAAVAAAAAATEAAKVAKEQLEEIKATAEQPKEETVITVTPRKNIVVKDLRDTEQKIMNFKVKGTMTQLKQLKTAIEQLGIEVVK